MKVLGIVASKRRSGNCEIAVKEISRNLHVEHELRLLRLPDFNLDYCTGCYRCLSNAQGCVLDDDLGRVLDAICWADALILAAPTYFLGAHASLKAFIDRAISFYGRSDRLWGKPAVGIGFAGMAGKEWSTQLDIERFLSVILAKNQGSRILHAAYPGEVLLTEENREAVSELASALLGSGRSRAKTCCPTCGGETFRFTQGNKARCMLCSCLGTFSCEDGRFSFEVDDGEYRFLFGEAEALRHREWLVQMKEGFRRRKEKPVSLGSDNEQAWVWVEKK